jgi:hypothetical protein
MAVQSSITLAKLVFPHKYFERGANITLLKRSTNRIFDEPCTAPVPRYTHETRTNPLSVSVRFTSKIIQVFFQRSTHITFKTLLNTFITKLVTTRKRVEDNAAKPLDSSVSFNSKSFAM